VPTRERAHDAGAMLATENSLSPQVPRAASSRLEEFPTAQAQPPFPSRPVDSENLVSSYCIAYSEILCQAISAFFFDLGGVHDVVVPTVQW
jgi:hypothetical protein